jgi:hypothetical protein
MGCHPLLLVDSCCMQWGYQKSCSNYQHNLQIYLHCCTAMFSCTNTETVLHSSRWTWLFVFRMVEVEEYKWAERLFSWPTHSPNSSLAAHCHAIDSSPGRLLTVEMENTHRRRWTVKMMDSCGGGPFISSSGRASRSIASRNLNAPRTASDFWGFRYLVE